MIQSIEDSKTASTRRQFLENIAKTAIGSGITGVIVLYDNHRPAQPASSEALFEVVPSQYSRLSSKTQRALLEQNALEANWVEKEFIKREKRMIALSRVITRGDTTGNRRLDGEVRQWIRCRDYCAGLQRPSFYHAES